MKYMAFIFLFFVCAACWAPRCPMDTCHVRQEHVHSDLVIGVFMGRYLYPPRIHFLWDANKGETNPDTKFQADGTSKSKRKLRKKFPWEKW
jgi:hypothetical protein